MNFKRVVVLFAALFGLLMVSSQTVSASVTYKKGLPKALVGKYWRTKIKRGTGHDGYPKGYPRFTYCHVTKHSIWFKASMADGLGIFASQNSSYYQDGTRHWYIAGDNPHHTGGDYEYFDIRAIKSYKTLKASNLFFDNDWNRRRSFTKFVQFHHFPKWHGRAAK